MVAKRGLRRLHPGPREWFHLLCGRNPVGKWYTLEAELSDSGWSFPEVALILEFGSHWEWAIFVCEPFCVTSLPVCLYSLFCPSWGNSTCFFFFLCRKAVTHGVLDASRMVRCITSALRSPLGWMRKREGWPGARCKKRCSFAPLHDCVDTMHHITCSYCITIISTGPLFCLIPVFLNGRDWLGRL